jgi:hypothetical protein
VVPRLLRLLVDFFFVVAFLIGQRKLKKLGSEPKKEQSEIVLII